ncbi:unnamed protein product, partial [Timema podura]|nr:unnamed protein product [Timema podura]
MHLSTPIDPIFLVLPYLRKLLVFTASITISLECGGSQLGGVDREQTK